MPNSSRRIVQSGSVSVVILLLPLLSGCAITNQQLQPLSVNELTMAQSGNNSVVLARADCRAPVSSGRARAGQLPSVSDSLWLVLGDAASAGLPRWVDSTKDFHILSKQALADGWIALVKPPGNYYLYLVGVVSVAVATSYPNAPPGGRYAHRSLDNGPYAWSDPLNGIADSRTAPSELLMSIENSAEPRKPTLRIEVPPGEPVIYAGSFHIDCPSDQSIVWVESATAVVEDQRDAAAAIARRDLQSLPPAVTRLAVQHSGPILLGVPTP